ncbi:unnamed protein product [Macrosiphum euphorbiae]|uniref:Secreted protein n=1 Tax=Macrosiphum euphorbiae TaxID=13131 RepID=A0AAV0XA67_9HEMI|nr:unnamed protein product [Macrosiphum euphorbiae]
MQQHHRVKHSYLLQLHVMRIICVPPTQLPLVEVQLPLSSTATATQSARVAESLVVIYAIGYVTPPPPPPVHCREPPNSITGIRNHCAQTV